MRSLENGVFPIFGDKKIHLLTSDDVDEAITPIQDRGSLEVANRTLKRINSIFRYGIYKKNAIVEWLIYQ